jgi:hypothetical protein
LYLIKVSDIVYKALGFYLLNTNPHQNQFVNVREE